MQLLVFLLVYPIIWLLSILPMRILYVISDVFFFLIFHVFGYRKKVVYDNIKLCFPEKSDIEIKIIQKLFFHHFIDIFIEMIKSFTISEKEISKRYKYNNVELILEAEKRNSIILMGSHYANWEWIFILNKSVTSNGYAAFNKIKNLYFDKKIRSSRERFGTKMIPTKQIIELMSYNNEHNIRSIYGFLNDQSPQIKKAHYWSEFMGIKVPIHTGSEFLAKQNNHSVIILKTKKVKRGYYESEFILVTETPNDFKDYEITEIFIRELESQIRETPEFYFWSHKRWKHRNKVPVEFK
jgi:KDO2-lipid IV(A) lauroyltransferase